MSDRLPAAVSGSVMRLRARCPFFAVLALHSTWIERPDIATAATNGEEIWFNKDFIENLEPAHRDFVVAHEVAHVALRHLSRRGPRDPIRWNVAADIVVNGMLARMGMKLAPGGLREESMEHLRVEDVYARLKTLTANQKRKLGVKEGSKLRDLLSEGPGGLVPEEGKNAQQVRAARDAVWRTAIQRASVIQRLHGGGQGMGGIGECLELSELMSPQLDWRTLLWRFLVRTPTDYVGWDRRFIHRGQYLDALAGESLTVAVCIDTSGSVDQEMLTDFMAELQGILCAYPHIRVKLYFADSELYGPYWLERDSQLPRPIGGGGTSFVPFFNAIDPVNLDEESVDLAVYQTDGYGDLPEIEPILPVLWLVPTGAREAFPWGEVARLEVA